MKHENQAITPDQLQTEILHSEYKQAGFFVRAEGVGSAECTIGYILKLDQPPESDVIYVDSLNVDQELQGNGYGHKIMGDLVQQARQQGFRFVRLGATNPAVITITEKLKAEGRVSDASYMITPARVPKDPSAFRSDQLPSAEFSRDEHRLSAADAIGHLERENQKEEESRQEGGEYLADSIQTVMAL